MKGSIRERSSGVWEVRAYVGADPVTGTKRTISRTVRGGKRQAQRALAELVAERPDRRAAAPARMTLNQLIEQHIDRHAGSPTTITEYRATWRRNIQPYVGRLPLHRVDAGILDQFYEYLQREKHLAPSTIRQ